MWALWKCLFYAVYFKQVIHILLYVSFIIELAKIHTDSTIFKVIIIKERQDSNWFSMYGSQMIVYSLSFKFNNQTVKMNCESSVLANKFHIYVHLTISHTFPPPTKSVCSENRFESTGSLFIVVVFFYI